MFNWLRNNIFHFKILYLWLTLIYFCKFYLTPFTFIESTFSVLGYALPIIALVLLFMDNKATVKWPFVCAIGLVYLVSNTNFNYVNDIQITLLLVLLFSNEEPVNVIKCTYWFMLGYFVINIVASCLGIIPNNVTLTSGRTHYIFNFAHHNKLSLYIFGLMGQIYYLFKKGVFKHKLIIVCSFIGLTVFTLFICESRTGGLIQLVLTLWCILDFYLIDKFSTLERLINKIGKFCWVLPILTLVVSLVISVIFNNESQIWQLLNKFVTGRFYLQHNYYLKNGFPLLGAGLKFCGYGCEVYDYVDNGLLRFVYENGLLFTCIITFGISFRIKQLIKDSNVRIMLIITLTYCMITIFEWISYLYCPFILILFSAFLEKKEGNI